MEQFIEDVLSVVKAHLKVTFTGQDNDIRGHIRSGMANITKWTGFRDFAVGADITDTQVMALALLKEYVRYRRDGAGYLFRSDYLSEIYDLQFKVVEDSVKKKAQQTNI